MRLGAIEAGGTKFVVAIGDENGNVLEVLRKDNTQITVSIDTWVFPVKPEIFDSGDFYQEN